MSGSKKYLRRPDMGELIIEIDAPLLEIVRQHLDQAGIPYEVLDAPPEPEPEQTGEDQPTKRRRSP